MSEFTIIFIVLSLLLDKFDPSSWNIITIKILIYIIDRKLIKFKTKIYEKRESQFY